MSEKAAKQSTAAKDVAAEMADALTPLGDVRSRSMFGGFGIFESGIMFVLIDSQGSVFFRTDSKTKRRYEDMGSEQHNPMPYHEVPATIMNDYSTFIEWANDAVGVAREAKKKNK